MTEQEFAEWFAANYPKDTIIHDPMWHASRIYRRAQLAAPTPNEPVAVFDGYIGGTAVIQWRDKGLPAGTLLYAAPVAAPSDAQDAARYRWIRDASPLQLTLLDWNHGKDLNAAIDARMNNAIATTNR